MDEERLKRHDLTDAEWLLLEPLLPSQTVHGARWNDHRTVMNGIFHRTRTATPWRDLPPCYGRWKTVYNRHRRWSLDGTWERILDGLRRGRGRGLDGQRGLDCGPRAPARGRGTARSGRRPAFKGACKDHEVTSAGREALGRSRGGLSTKIHLVADRRCRPISRILTPGQHADCPKFIPLLKSIRIPRRGPGRPRNRPARAMADKA